MHRLQRASFLGTFLLFTFTALAQAELRLQLHAGGHARENCPVFFTLPEEIKSARSFTLIREADNQEVPVQKSGVKDHPRLAWMITDRLEAGEKRIYKLTANDGRPKRDPRVAIDDDGAKLTVTVEGSPVLRFNHAVVEAPEGIKPIYRRSGYLHPVFSPQGNVVTGDFEPDHAHQHGVFNAFVNASFRDQPVDFWNQAKGLGDVEFESLQFKRNGPVFAQFAANLVHVVIRDGKRIPAIKERWQLRVYNSQKPFLFEINSRQVLAGDDPVTVNEHRYGGFGIRGPSEWLPRKEAKNDEVAEQSDPPASGDFVTSEGRTRLDGNHTRSRWVEMHGPVGTQHAGIIVLSANGNFRSPQTVRLHPSKPYFCFAPMVLGGFQLEPDDVYAQRYRFVTHDGPPNADLAERMWQDLAHPAKVTVVD